MGGSTRLGRQMVLRVMEESVRMDFVQLMLTIRMLVDRYSFSSSQCTCSALLSRTASSLEHVKNLHRYCSCIYTRNHNAVPSCLRGSSSSLQLPICPQMRFVIVHVVKRRPTRPRLARHALHSFVDLRPRPWDLLKIHIRALRRLP